MAENHDIFLRAYAFPVNPKRKRKRTISNWQENTSKWPAQALVIDTETRITADQSLTFGIYRLCELVGDEYILIQEGLFYADALPARERRVLETYQGTAIQGVPSFPPVFPLYSRFEFMRRVFWPAIRRDGALICGLNLPFDLSRLALAWNRGRHGEWSLTMSRHRDGRDNPNRPRILITPIDSKKAFIKMATPWKRKEWKDEGESCFLDLRTLGWALFNQSFSLKSLCRQLKTKNQKQKEHSPTGKVSIEEIEYARQDGRCTVDCLNGLKREFDWHPIPLKPYRAYSPASIAKSYLETMGIVTPAQKFKLSPKKLGIAMQTYYGGRSETHIRCTEVPVVPVDFTSEYPTCCALVGLFDVLTAKEVTYVEDTENIRSFLNTITLNTCFEPAIWEQFKFFALVQPDNDILPVRTTYDGVTQNIGNNYLSSDTPMWFAAGDLIASVIRSSGKVPKIIRAVRLVAQGKQSGMRSVNLRRSMVEINPYKDDLFRKVIEQRKLNKADEALYYWLKIFANSIYGFFVELNPEDLTRNVPVIVFSGEKKFLEPSDTLENEGAWFFPPLASLITSAGRLLLAMTESCVEEKKGTYLFCDTDSLAVVSSKTGGSLDIPGSGGVRILPWDEVTEIADRFASLNPYDPSAVKGSILNLVDANYIDSDSSRPRQLYGYSIAAKRYALYEKKGSTDVRIADPKAHGIGFLYPPKDSPKNWKEDVPQWTYELWDYIVRGALGLKRRSPTWLKVPQMMRLTITTYNVLAILGDWEIARPYNFLFMPMVDKTFGYATDMRPDEKPLLICPFSSDQKEWFHLECLDVHSGKKYRMVDYNEEKNPPHNVVFPSQFERLVTEYQGHPEAKSLAPDGSQCKEDTKGLLRRAHVVAGEIRYIGKETDRKWEEGDDLSVPEFKSTEYGRSRMVVASEEVRNEIKRIGIKRCARESGFDRKNLIRKLVRGLPVKRTSYESFVRWLEGYKEQIAVKSHGQ
jgi:hypothetical protein